MCKKTLFKRIILITSIVIAVAVIIAAVYQAGLYYATYYVFDYMFSGEEHICSNDGKYGYLQLSSPKKRVCTVIICDETGQYGAEHKQTLHTFFRQKDMEDISWGKQSYDLFFNTPEAGPYVYAYHSSGQWLGPLYFDEGETAEKRLQGDEEAYCFDISFETNVEEFPEYSTWDTIIIKKETIPEKFLERLDAGFSQY